MTNQKGGFYAALLMFLYIIIAYNMPHDFISGYKRRLCGHKPQFKKKKTRLLTSFSVPLKKCKKGFR